MGDDNRLGALDAATLDRLAGALDVDRAEFALTVRELLRSRGMPTGQEIHLDDWRVDPPAGVAHAVLAGAVGATVLRGLDIESVPLAGLGALAEALLEIGDVEVRPAGAVVRAGPRAPAGVDPALLVARLPERLRAALPAERLTELVERLRRASTGVDGLLIRPPGSRQGFWLVVSAARDTGPPPQSPPAPAVRSPRVFISYAHDSAEHKDRVRELAFLLRRYGVDVRMDQWDTEHRRDWQVWATHEIRAADYVLVIASPMCRRVGDGEVDPYRHRGLQSELRTLRELYHAEPAVWPRRCLPVVLPGGTVSDIPVFLQPRTADHYLVRSIDLSGVEHLLRLLTGQPADRRPAVGPVPVLPPRPAPEQGAPR